LPEHLHEHIDLVQPTTLFSNFRPLATTIHSDDSKVTTPVFAAAPPIKVPSASGGKVDANCNSTITISCLKQLYNAVGYVPSATNGNQIGVTGYLRQVANFQDLQDFYADQLPEAVNSNFTYISVNGTIRTCASYIPITDIVDQVAETTRA
jgi:tripeptidyl-peptidase I